MNAFKIDAKSGQCSFMDIKSYKDTQREVGGWIELLPSAKSNQEFEASVNEEGELIGLVGNAEAGRILDKLGFEMRFLMRPYLPAGNVVIMRNGDDKPFTTAQKQRLLEASASEDNEDEKEKEREDKKE